MKLTEILEKITGYEKIAEYSNKTYVELWKSWYSGKVKDFHFYSYYNGVAHIPAERMSLGMAKKICEDWANLLINEKTDITLSDENTQKNIEKIFEDCDFWQKANDGIEKIFAFGGGAFVVSVEGLSIKDDGSIIPDGNINISFCNAEKVYPITVEDGKITECAFIRSDSNNTNIAVHLKDETGNYVIHNLVATGKDLNSLTMVPESEYIFNTQSKTPWFVYLRPNIANNIDIDSPLGISVFANAIDTLKEIDIIYDSYANEFLLGRKRIFVNAKQAVIDMKSGEQKATFDTRDGAFYVLPEADDGSVFIQNDTQSLRVSDHKIGIQDQLNMLSQKCGMGTEHYKFDSGSVATATQIISENSDMFRTIKRHEVFVEKALKTIVNAVIYASNTFTSVPMKPDVTIEVKFDDSIIEDKVAERAQDRLDMSQNVMSKAEYRSKWYNEDLETAQKHIDEIGEFTIDDNDTDEYQVNGEENK